MTQSLAFLVSARFGKLQLSSFLLVALLQRTPVVRLIAAAESVCVSSSIGQLLKASAAVASMLGAVDTLAGATGFVTNPVNPAEATVGVQFSAVFAYTGGATTVGSYAITNLPPGLSVPGAVNGTLNSSAGTIVGIPTQAGDFTVGLIAYDDPNLGDGVHGHAAGSYTISVFPGAVGPAITSQPSSQSVTAGQPVSFSVTATGDPVLTYQWRKGGADLSGATTSTYTIAATVAGDAGTYSVKVTNVVNSVTSGGAVLTVNAATAAPTITTQPFDQTASAGGSVTFMAAASGFPAPAYQWKKNGVNIGGATNANYTIASVADSDAGDYAVVATNTAGFATSNNAHLSVILPPSNAVVSITVE